MFMHSPSRYAVLLYVRKMTLRQMLLYSPPFMLLLVATLSIHEVSFSHLCTIEVQKFDLPSLG